MIVALIGGRASCGLCAIMFHLCLWSMISVVVRVLLSSIGLMTRRYLSCASDMVLLIVLCLMVQCSHDQHRLTQMSLCGLSWASALSYIRLYGVGFLWYSGGSCRDWPRIGDDRWCSLIVCSMIVCLHRSVASQWSWVVIVGFVIDDARQWLSLSNSVSCRE